MTDGGPVTTLSEHACFGGVQGFHEHASRSIGLPMRFGVFRPPQASSARVPVLFYLAGLECNEQTFATKAGAQQHAAKHGLMLVTPDTSPRGTGVAEADAAWDFGTAAGFYLDATEAPWRANWRMATWLTQELPALIDSHFPADTRRLGVFGHSMGGHGALTLGLKHPALFRSVSAFAPIAAPMRSPWGEKAFRGYLGEDRAAWREHDATELVKAGARTSPLLVDQGLGDRFLATQLHPELFEAACAAAGQPLTLRRHPHFDHGYYFISTFVADHIAHHAAGLSSP